MKFCLCALAFVLAASSPLGADVTITSTVSGKGFVINDQSTQSISYIKGSKMRMEMGDYISILDAASRQMIVLNAKKKEAEIIDVTKMASDMQKNIAGPPKVSLTPTGQSKTLLGRSCAEYTATIAVPMKMGDSVINMTMSGPLWVAKGAPGSADYSAFYKAAAENGLFFGNPQLAKSQGAQLQSQTEMYRAIASLNGIPYQIDTQLKFEGGGMMGGMMNKMGGVAMSTAVTTVSTGALADELFTIPAGYKTKTK